MFKLVAAAALVLAAPASAALYEYSHVESPGAVFETNYDPSGPDNANGVFEVTFAPGQNQNCATIGLDIDEAGDETVSLIGSPSAGQSYHAGPYVAGALANAVRGASRPGCRGLDNSIAAAAASNDNYVALSHNVGAVPEGSWVRVTFRLSSTNQGGNGIALGSGLFLTSSQETLDSFGCDEADVPAQCLHAREAAPEARITSEATGGRITASSARKCLTVAVIANDGQDHQAECNYEGASGSDSDGETAVKRA